MKALLKTAFVIGLLLWAGGSSFLTYILFQLDKESTVSFALATESFELAKDKMKLATNSDEALAMARVSLQKMQDEHKKHLPMHEWDVEGYNRTVSMTKQAAYLTQASIKGAWDARASRKDMLESVKLTKDLLALQKNGLVRAKEMYALTQQLAPFSEMIAKMLPGK